MVDLQRKASPLHVALAIAIVGAGAAGVFRLLDPDHPAQLWPFLAHRGPAAVDLWKGLRFDAVYLYFNEFQGVRQTVPTPTRHAPDDGTRIPDPPTEPLRFESVPPPGLLTPSQKDQLRGIVLTELRRGKLLAGPPAERTADTHTCTLTINVTIETLPGDLVLCKLTASPDITVEMTSPQAGVATVYPDRPDTRSFFPHEFFSTRSRLYDDVAQAIVTDLRMKLDRARPEMYMNLGAWTPHAGGAVTGGVPPPLYAVPTPLPTASPTPPQPRFNGPPGGVGEIPAGPDMTPRQITPSAADTPPDGAAAVSR